MGEAALAVLTGAVTLTATRQHPIIG